MKRLLIKPKLVFWLRTSADAATLRARLANWAEDAAASITTALKGRDATIVAVHTRLRVTPVRDFRGNQFLDIYPKLAIELQVPDRTSRKQAHALLDATMDAIRLDYAARLVQVGDLLLKTKLARSDGSLET